VCIDAIIETYRQALLEFLQGPRRNQHVVAGPVTTYLRKSSRPLDGKIEQALDLASIDIKPAWQKKAWQAESSSCSRPRILSRSFS